MKTLIIDNYDSFSYNLYQLIGELGAQPEIVRNDHIQVADIEKKGYSHVIISPGPGAPEDQEYFGVCREVIVKYGSRLPMLGVCLGHQGIVSAYGGKVIVAKEPRHGKLSRIKHNNQGIFVGLPNEFLAMRYHSLVGEAKTLPKCLEITALAEDDREIMAIRHTQYPTSGVQFHPESVGTKCGKKLLRNFFNSHKL